jgi:hypothetical protein
MHPLLLSVLNQSVCRKPDATSSCILHTAREDVVRVKRWVSGSHTKRTNAAEKTDGPAPSQRAMDSLSSVRALALLRPRTRDLTQSTTIA